VDTAFDRLGEARVALGFPDIILGPTTSFRDLAAKQEATGADVVLGLFPTDQDARSDMVERDESGRAVQIVIKQPPRGLAYSWVSAVWTPRFSRYLHDFLAVEEKLHPGRELHVGDVVQAAIDDGYRVDTVAFADGYMVDIGTPQGAREAKKRVAETEGASSSGARSSV
jgi:glucose-1-phosphate thymidylyltransferase